MYAVKFFDQIDKKQCIIWVDDIIPWSEELNRPMPIYAHILDQNNQLSANSLWIIILEKAYAKFLKSLSKEGNKNKSDYDYL